MAPPGEITEYGEVDSAPLARGYHVPDGRSRGKRGAVIHSHTLHGLVWDQRPMGLTHDILIVWVARLAHRTTRLDLLDGLIQTNVIHLEPLLHASSLLPHSGVVHVVVPSFT